MDKRYYSAPGQMGIKAFVFIGELMRDPTLNLNEPMVDNYLMDIGVVYLGWSQTETHELIQWMKLKGMLV
jgi:hypothetical protein